MKKIKDDITLEFCERGSSHGQGAHFASPRECARQQYDIPREDVIDVRIKTNQIDMLCDPQTSEVFSLAVRNTARRGLQYQLGEEKAAAHHYIEILSHCCSLYTGLSILNSETYKAGSEFHRLPAFSNFDLSKYHSISFGILLAQLHVRKRLVKAVF